MTMPRRWVWRGVAASSLLLVAGLSVLTRSVWARGQSGDADRGKALYEKCAACHRFDDERADGPTLKGLFGRKAGSLEVFRYSAAMKRSDVTWDRAALDRFLADPQAFIPGNRMAFAGIADAADRADLIAYIEREAGKTVAR